MRVQEVANERTDEPRTCCDCGTPYVFTVGEQRFYESKNFHPPKRCPACRPLKRQRVESRLTNGHHG